MLAGIGNVFKSEVLFIHRLDPWRTVGEIAPETRDAVLDTAVRLMRANATGPGARRVTTGELAAGRGDLHVYGRNRRPCPRCQRPIAVARQGEQARLTYWCVSCQGPGPAAQRGRDQRPEGAGAADG
jgi:endonuclease-8